MMNWSDERYVRLYSRITPAQGSWRWEAWAVWPWLLVAADRTGFIQVAVGPRRWRELAGVCHLPPDVVEAGVLDLLDDTCLVEVAGGFLIRNFIEAQEAIASNRKRSREKREKRRAAKLGATRNVSPRHGSHSEGSEDGGVDNPLGDTKRVTSPRTVTNGHGTLQNDTPYRAVPPYRQQGRSAPVASSADGRTATRGPVGVAVPHEPNDFQTSSSPFPPPEDKPPRGPRKAKRGGGGEKGPGSREKAPAPRVARPAGTAAKVVALPLRSKLLDIPEADLDPNRADHCLELFQRYRMAALRNGPKAREPVTIDHASQFVGWHIRWKEAGFTGWDMANAYLLYLSSDGDEKRPFKRHDWCLRVWMTDGICEQRLRAAASGENALLRPTRRL
jgi:hypothetical protein